MDVASAGPCYLFLAFLLSLLGFLFWLSLKSSNLNSFLKTRYLKRYNNRATLSACNFFQGASLLEPLLGVGASVL